MITQFSNFTNIILLLITFFRFAAFHINFRCVTLCDVVYCNVMLCCFVSRHVLLCCVVSSRVVSCRVVSCRLVLCRFVMYFVYLLCCIIMLYFIVLCHNFCNLIRMYHKGTLCKVSYSKAYSRNKLS